MSPRYPFPCFMVDVELGSSPKIGRLNDAQFRCLMTGVWALAAKGNPRGYLVVAGEAATAEDVAHQGRCSTATARSTLEVLRKLGMVEMDSERGLEFCHDWWTMNPDPKPDPTNSERQARYRNARRNGTSNVELPGISNGVSQGVTSNGVTPPEVKEEGKGVEANAPTPAARVALPADFPPELRPHLVAVYRVLRALAERHDAKQVNPYSLALTVASRSHKPLVLAAHDFAAWADSKAQKRKDVIAGYRKWLDRTDDLAGIEPLDNNGRPAAAIGAAVVSLAGRRENASDWLREMNRPKGDVA